MRALTTAEIELISGGYETGMTTITVTGTPPGGGGGGWSIVGGGGGSGGGGGGGGGPSPPPPPPPSDCPAAPTIDYASHNPTVVAALATAHADLQSVQRADDAWSTVVSAANAHNIDPALLAAVGVRESGFRDISQIGGGKGEGVFQIDLGAHPDVSKAQADDLNFSANYAANLLQTNMTELATNYPSFTPAQLEQATAASYNFGTGNITGNPATIDQGSTGNNYGSNVVDLTHAFKVPGTDMTPGSTAPPGSPGAC